jgi:transcriptional regulator with XRE-family HTH domain
MRWMRTARDAQGLTLDQLAEATGIDRATLNRYELGRQAPSFERGMLVARVLGVSLDSIARGETDGSATGRGKNLADVNSPAPTAATR